MEILYSAAQTVGGEIWQLLLVVGYSIVPCRSSANKLKYVVVFWKQAQKAQTATAYIYKGIY